MTTWNHTDLPYTVEYARTGRAKCQVCFKPIDDGSLRVAILIQSPWNDGKMAKWHHPDCFFKECNPKTIEDIDNFHSISFEDQEYIEQKIALTRSSKKCEVDEKKRKEVKYEEAQEDIPPVMKNIKLSYKNAKKKLSDQQEELLSIKDELSSLKKEELIDIMRANNQDFPIKRSKIVDILADALLFGALEPCPKCDARLELKLDETGYKCTGYTAEKLPCKYVTQDPKRKEAVIPKYLKEKYFFLDIFEPKVQCRLLKIFAPRRKRKR